MTDRLHAPDRIQAISRRGFLRAAGLAGGTLAVASHLGRGRALAQEVKADSSVKPGGTLRYGVHTAPAHFDVHQSGTVANIGAQSPMYDTLLRRDPRDGQTIIPDLAYKWEISPDGKKYTFHLRKGVKFHDGADFTAEDVKATFERIARPPKGVVIPRTPLFATVGEIVVVDPHRDRVPHDRGAAAGLHARRLRQRLEHHRPEEDPRGQPGQPAPGHGLSGHRPLPPRLAEGQGSLDHGAEPQLLEQGVALPGQARDLPHAAVLAGARRGVPLRQARLRAAAGSGELAQGQGDAGRHGGGVQPERHPGLLDEQEEEAVPGRARAPRHPPRHGPPDAGRGGEGHGADAGRRASSTRSTRRRRRGPSWTSAWATRRTPRRPSRRRRS